MKRIVILIGLLIFMLMLAPVGVTHAAPDFDRIIGEGDTVEEDLVIFGGSLEVKNGATVDGDVSVFGGNAVLNGDIDGDVAVFGGYVELGGSISGDLVILGGSLQASTSAAIDGDCILVGGSISGDGASGLNCAEVGEFPGVVFPGLVNPPVPPVLPDIPEPPAPPEPPVPPAPPAPRTSSGSGIFGTIAAAAGRSLLFGILALAIGYLAPNQLNQVRGTLKQKPAASGAVGVLTVIAVPTVAIILVILSAILTIICIGLLGFPIVLAILIALAVGLVLGWVAAGTLLGERLATWLKMSNRSLPMTAALGTAVLTLAAGFLSSLPFLLGGWFWWLAAILICCAGLGAVALTRFGTRPYPFVVGYEGEKVATVLETLPVEEDSDAPQKPPVDEG